MPIRKDDEALLAQLDFGEEEKSKPQRASRTASKAAKSTPTQQQTTDEDELAELAKLAQAPSRPSRPSTPSMVSSSTTSGTTNKSPKRAEHTPVSSGPPSERTSEDRLRAGTAQPRKSGESTRSFHQSYTPGTTEESSPNEKAEFSKSKAEEKNDAAVVGGGGGGGWWGSMFNAATAAVKQAETLAKEIRGNEEAQKWAELAKGRARELQSFSTDLRSRALPTFTSLLQHIAPPISAHERLQIHTTHDILAYPSLDPLIYSVFSRIMSQVEGGDLLVIQRGTESRNRASSELQGYKGGVLSSGGWSDGPWWRDDGVKRDIGAVAGLREGSRLTRVSAESYAKEFFDSRGGVEEAAKRATETLSETNPVRSSDIFLAIQAISYRDNSALFAADAHDKASADESVAVPEDEAEDLICFAVYLHDPMHALDFSTLSQPMPQKWSSWLDAATSDGAALPDSISEIIESGGVDPREWVAEWIEEILSLAVGVVAQRYVARRMGVGEGGIGRGKRRVEEDGDNAGEAARAM